MLWTPKNATAAEAAKAIRECVEVGALTVPQHALDAARDDGLSEADIEAVLEVGDVVADRSHPERWCVKCPGSAIVVVELEADPWTVVITAFYP